MKQAPTVAGGWRGGRRMLVILVLAVAAGSWLQRDAYSQSVDLGTAENFAVLAGSGITNTGTTTIYGDVGTHPTPSITGFNSVILYGVNHGDNSVTEQAKFDLLAAYNYAAGLPSIATGMELGGLVLTPGVYNNPVGFQITGMVTLDGQGSSDGVWIFQTDDTLITASNSIVLLINGANACNIFWQVGSSATLGTNTDFAGTILADTSITLNTGATVNGRVLALNGAVTMDGNTISRPICDLSVDGILPSFYGGILNTGMALSHNQGQLLSQQLNSRRLGRQRHRAPIADDEGSAKRVVGVSNAKSGGWSGGKGALDLENQPQPSAYVDDTRWNAWVQGSGMFSGGGLGMIPGENFASGTFMAGADRAVTEHLAVGLFTSYQEGRGNYDNGGRMDLESVRAGAYAALDFDGFYANGAVGVGTTEYDVRRPILWPTLDRIASSETDGSEYFAMLGAGYDFHVGKFTFGPSVTAQYTHLSINGFTEEGADSLDLRVSDFGGESLRTYLGGRIAYTHRVNPDLAVIPELRAFWQHEHLDQEANIYAELDGGNGAGFDYLTVGPGDDAVFAGTGVSVLIGDNLTLSTFYHAGFGGNNAAQHSVSVSANLRF